MRIVRGRRDLVGLMVVSLAVLLSGVGWTLVDGQAGAFSSARGPAATVDYRLAAIDAPAAVLPFVGAPSSPVGSSPVGSPTGSSPAGSSSPGTPVPAVAIPARAPDHPAVSTAPTAVSPGKSATTSTSTDGQAFIIALNQVRVSANESVLTRDSCLDAVAAALARVGANGGNGAILTGPQANVCGAPTAWSGWVEGADPTGAQFVGAAITRTTTGPSPAAYASVKRIGVAMVELPNGPAAFRYLLAWVVAA